MKPSVDRDGVAFSRDRLAEAVVVRLALPVWVLAALLFVSKALSLGWFTSPITLLSFVGSWFLARVLLGLRRGDFLRPS